MTTNDKIILGLVFVALIVFAIVIHELHSDCLDSGRQFVRGIFLFECVK